MARTKQKEFTYEYYFKINNGPEHSFDECTPDELHELKERISDRLAYALGYQPSKYIYYDPDHPEKSLLRRFM